jgi:hypothetical protein
MDINSASVAGTYPITLQCDAGADVIAFVIIQTDTPVSLGVPANLEIWKVKEGATSGTKVIGTGAFVEPDAGQTLTITNTAAAVTWLTYNTGPQTFTVNGAGA